MICKGQRYRTTIDIPVGVMTHWAIPFTGGYDRVLPAGVEFTIVHDTPAHATSAGCDIVEYGRFEKVLVPLRNRIQIWAYRGYSVSIPLRLIEECCALIS